MTEVKKLDAPGLDIRMHVTTDIEASYRIHACAKEPWTAEWIRSMPPNSVLYDVGANVGSYSLLAAALGHKVVAIEPGYANYARLCDNIVLNNFQTQIIPLCLALSDQSGLLTLPQDPRPGYSGGSLHLQVPRMMLDQLVGPGFPEVPRPTHLKLDIDGYEAESRMLHGGMRTLQAGLSLMAEFDTRGDRPCLDLLGTLDYECAQTWRERNGQPIQNVYYSLWQPVPAVVN